MLKTRKVTEKDYKQLHALLLQGHGEVEIPVKYEDFLQVCKYIVYFGNFYNDELVSVVGLFNDPDVPNALMMEACCKPEWSRRAWNKEIFKRTFQFAFKGAKVDFIWAETDNAVVQKSLRGLGFVKLLETYEGTFIYSLKHDHVLPKLRA